MLPTNLQHSTANKGQDQHASDQHADDLDDAVGNANRDIISHSMIMPKKFGAGSPFDDLFDEDYDDTQDFQPPPSKKFPSQNPSYKQPCKRGKRRPVQQLAVPSRFVNLNRKSFVSPTEPLSHPSPTISTTLQLQNVAEAVDEEVEFIGPFFNVNAVSEHSLAILTNTEIQLPPITDDEDNGVALHIHGVAPTLSRPQSTSHTTRRSHPE